MRKIILILLLQPFQANSQETMTGNKLFSLMDPAQTGIRFSNEILDKEEHSILLYSNYYGGGGVGIGDINNDGLQDIFLTGNLVSNRLYLNKGNMVFEDITEKAGITHDGGWSSGVLFGDVNDDGYLDIYVTRELYDDRPELRNNLLYINNGNGSFSEKATDYGIQDTSRTRHAAFLDYDKDGDIDIFLLNQPPNPGDYSPFYTAELLLDEYSPKLYENQGGSFKDVTIKAGLLKPGFGNSVTASDLNGDGWTDLWVANDYWAGDFMYINNKDGTFADRINGNVKHITYSSMGIDAGDINNDGLLDVFVLEMIPEDQFRRHSNMGGMTPDSFWRIYEEGGHLQYFINTFFINLGNERFSEISRLAGVSATDWSWSVFFADLDNDGWKDIYIANGLLRDIRDFDGAINFKNFIEASIQDFLTKNPDPENISIWDIVNMDSAMNISPSVKLLNYVYRNNHDLTFSRMNEEWGFTHKTFSNGCAYGDLDNDGDLDIVVNNINEPASVYRNNLDHMFAHHYLRIKPVADGKYKNIFGTKVRIETSDGIQFSEITSVRGMYSTSEYVAHFGLGNIQLINKVTVTWPDGKESVLTNVKPDQQIDVRYSRAKSPVFSSSPSHEIFFTNITQNSGLEFRHIENKFDDYRLQVLLPYKMSELSAPLAVGDINGDGLGDVFTGNASGTEGKLFIQNTDGTFRLFPSEAIRADKMSEDAGAAFFDADQDGDHDLYVVSGGNEFRPRAAGYQDRLYLNDGSGNFSKAVDVLPKMNISGSKVLPNDFDKDGDLDLFIGGRHIPWSYPDPESSTLLRNDSGRFVNVTKELAPDLIGIGMVNDAVWTDFNNDGLTDLVVVGEWMPVTLFQNMGIHFKNVTAEYGLDKNTGWWFSIEAADMDRDGDIDLVAGNFGLNSEYLGTPEEPLEIYYTDLDNNGLKDIVFGFYEEGKLYPLTRKREAALQTPFINEKYRSYAAYARADIFEIYGRENLGRGLHYSASTFASMYLENKGDSLFGVHPLPNLAQFSSVNDILIHDFTKDGNPDILMSGNLYSMETNYPRNDAGYGLLLAGDGKGNFDPVDLEKSGFYLPYDVKSLAMINTNHGKLILAGCNNDTLQVFHWNGK